MDYRSLYAAEREILALYLFGSAATGGWTRLSDIDLVVPNEAPPLLKHRVVTEFAARKPRTGLQSWEESPLFA